MPARARTPDTTPDRAFHIGDVLSAVTGVVLSRRGEPGVEAFYSHVLGRAVRMPDIEWAFHFVREHVLAAHPGLGTFYGVEVPTYEFAGTWVRRRAREFGAYLPVAPLPEGHPLRNPRPGPPDPRPPYPPAATSADRYAELRAAILAAYAEICALAGARDAPRDGATVPRTRSPEPPGVTAAGDAATPPPPVRSSAVPPGGRRPDASTPAPDGQRRAFVDDQLLLLVAADVPWPAGATVAWADRAPTSRDGGEADGVPCLPVFTSLTHLALTEGAPLPLAPAIVPRAQLGPGRPVRATPAVIADAD